jgi:hypothetical protein
MGAIDAGGTSFQVVPKVRVSYRASPIGRSGHSAYGDELLAGAPLDGCRNHPGLLSAVGSAIRASAKIFLLGPARQVGDPRPHADPVRFVSALTPVPKPTDLSTTTTIFILAGARPPVIDDFVCSTPEIEAFIAREGRLADLRSFQNANKR